MGPIEPMTIRNAVGPSKFGATEKMSANIKVVVRVRPPNEKELNSRTVVEIVDDRMLVFDPKEHIEPFFYQGVQQQNRNFLRRTNKQLKFMFDNVFGGNSSNEDVFKATTKNTFSDLMDGFNCSVFVYGATGAGKTFTMIGNRDYPGITYLTMDELFKSIASYEHEREFDICVSYLEVYNENVLDLLKPTRGALQLREDAKFGVIVAGLTIDSIKTARELLDMLERGNQNRTQHPTDANAESSRSHAVFQVYVKMRYKTSGEVRIVKLSMIDLAGSERASATGCSGDRFKESANINKSLLALGNCINKLAEGSKFIPYRDSKLTRLLKDSLGGNCQTIMIANVSPAGVSYEDTYNTLKYAARANKIQLSIKKNIVDCDMHVSQYVKIVEELRKQVKELKNKLAAGGRVPSAPSATPAAHSKLAHVPDNKLLVKVGVWRTRLSSAFSEHHTLVRGYLEMMSRQRALALRHYVRQQGLAQLVDFCDEAEEEHAEILETCRIDVMKQIVAVEKVTRKIKFLQCDLQRLWNELATSTINLDKLSSQAISECPDIELYLDGLRKESQLLAAQASDRHKSKLLQIHSEENNTLRKSIKEMPTLLRKLYLILMGYNKITPSLTDEYLSIFRNIKSIRTVSWWNEKDEQEGIHGDFECLFSLEVAEPSYLSGLMTAKSEIKALTNSDVSATRKRKATPTKIWSTDALSNATIVIDDSFVEENKALDSTQVINVTPMKKRMLGRNALCDIDVNKPIDAGELNSTFLLAGKIDTALVKKKPHKSAAKVTVGKPVVGKALPFRRPFPHQLNSVGAKPAAVEQGTPAVKQGVQQRSVGFKAVRGRDRIQRALPYARPEPTKR